MWVRSKVRHLQYWCSDGRWPDCFSFLGHSKSFEEGQQEPEMLFLIVVSIYNTYFHERLLVPYLMPGSPSITCMTWVGMYDVGGPADRPIGRPHL